MWDRLPGVGPELLGFRIPPFSLKSHCSGNCMEDPHGWILSIMVTYCLELELHRACNTFCFPSLFFNNIKPEFLLPTLLERFFLGLFFFMAVCWWNYIHVLQWADYHPLLPHAQLPMVPSLVSEGAEVEATAGSLCLAIQGWGDGDWGRLWQLWFLWGHDGQETRGLGVLRGLPGLLLLIVMVGQSAEDVYEIPQGLRALNDCMLCSQMPSLPALGFGDGTFRSKQRDFLRWLRLVWTRGKQDDF